MKYLFKGRKKLINDIDKLINENSDLKKKLHDASIRKDLSVGISFTGNSGSIAEAKENQSLSQITDFEIKYRLLADNIVDVLWVLDLKTNHFSYVSPSVEQLLSFTVEEIMSQPFEAALTKNSLDYLNSIMPERLKDFLINKSSDKRYVDEIDQLRKNGSTVNTEVVTRYIFNDSGDIEIIGVSRDISERSKTLHSLEERERKYRLLADNVEDVIFTLDLNFKYTYISPSVKKLRGFTPEEVLKMNWQNALTPESAQIALSALGEEMASGDFPNSSLKSTRTLELQMFKKDGSTIWTEVKLSILFDENKKPAGILGTSRDISGRRQAESAYQKKNKMLAALNDYSLELASLPFTADIFPVAAHKLKDMTGAVAVSISIYDESSKDLICQYITLSSQEHNKLIKFLGRRMEGMRFKVNDEMYRDIMEFLIKDSGSLSETTFGSIPPAMGRIIERTFGIEWFTGMGLLYNDKLLGTVVFAGKDIHNRPDNEELKAFAGVTANSLRRWMAEKNALANEVKYRLMTEKMQDVIWQVNPDYIITYISPSDFLQRGYSNDEVVGKSIFQFLTPESAEYARTSISERKEIHNNGFKLSGLVLEVEQVCKDGANIWTEVVSNPIYDEKGKLTGFQGVNRDISARKKAEDALRDSEERYRQLVELLPDGIVVHCEGKILLVNPAAARIMGAASMEDIYRRPVIEFVHPDYRQYALERIQQSLKNNTIAGLSEEVFIRFDGTAIYVEVTAIPFVYFGKKSMLTAFNDISERKEYETALISSEFKYRSLVERMQEGLIVVDNNDVIQLVNSKFCKILDYTDEELIGKVGYEILVEENVRKIIQEKNLQRIEGKTDQYEIIMLKKGGERVNLLMNAAPIVDSFGNSIGSMATCLDITERKISEEKIKKQNVELIRVNSEKDKFFSIIAHDLKSPFTGLLGLSKILASDIPNMSLSSIQEYANDLQNLARNLFDLLENLLEWAMMQRGRIPYIPKLVNVNELIGKITRLVSQSASHKDLTISANIPADTSVIADINMLDAVLRNLLSNAVKFTPRGGRISIDAKFIANSFLKFSVSDSGIGIAPEFMDKLFRLDTRVSTPGTEGEPSTGLGLLLCKEYLDKHGCVLQVESKPGLGSVFSFELPLAETDDGVQP